MLFFNIITQNRVLQDSNCNKKIIVMLKKIEKTKIKPIKLEIESIDKHLH